MKMRLDFRLKLILLVLVVISNVHFKCQGLVEASSQQKQQQQPLRQIGPQAGKNSSSVERIAAILSAKPRPGSATQAASQQQQAAPSLSNAKKVVNQPVRLHSEASTLDARSVSNLTAASVGGKLTANGAKNQGKRQAGEFGVGDPVAHRLSRRNEDPWFLDQAPLPLQPYRFNYNVKDKNGLTEQYRQETGDGKFLTGSYGYVLPDGIFRHVDYVADDRGFRAFIRTSEPGTANQNPADVVINSSPVPGSLGYVSPAVVRSNFINSQPSLLLGGQQQQQQPQAQPTPQLNWADQQQPQLPSATWNYSTLGPSQFGSLSDRFKTNLDGSGVLARRAPGSIVGTPLRNFSSFAYPLQAPSVDLGPTTSSYLTSQDPSNISNFQSLSHFGDLARLKPISSGSNSWLSNNLTKLNAIGGDAQFQTHLTDSKTDRVRDRERPSGGEPTSGGISPGILQDSGARYASLQELKPAPNLSFAQPTFHHQRPGLLLASRVGPDVLLYDRPFGVQQVAGEPLGSNKLAYDYNHVLVRDSAVPYLAEERARSLAYLEQLKALSRNIARPDLATNELATLSPFGELSPRPPASGQSGQTSSGGISGETTTKATSSSHSEQHHEHKSTTSQVVDDMSRLTVTKEHKSGSSSGSGHDLGTSSRQPSGGGGGGDTQLLTPPPQPQFSSGGGGTSQHRWATKGQQQQQHLARLLAPYADEHQFGAKGGVKGGHEQQFNYDHRGQQPSTSAPAVPDEPRAPVEPSQPSGDPDQARQTGTSTTRTTPSDEIDLNLATASKSPPQTMRPAHEQQHHQVRSVRMPDDYRTSMLMNDLRSMQNALGLPQPPRLQRSSSLDGEHRSSNGLSFGPANLAEQIVAARMHRVETLLNGGNVDSSNHQVAPQQASVQRSVAVRADKLEDKNQLREDRNKLDKISLLSMLNKPMENEVDDDQPRRLSTGPVLKQLGGQQHQQQQSSGSGQANETSMFEAQRLNNNNRARLRAEKVSELEKFQQRLRTQQLMLEHVKSNESKANSSAAPRQPMLKTLANNSARVNEANSHVKYDEPQENEQLGTIGKLAIVSGGSAASESGEPARLRRQNDMEAAGNRTRTSSPKATTEAPTSRVNNQPQAIETTRAPAASEFARQLHQWPSISNGLERQRSNNSTSNSDANSSTSGSVGLKAHKMDSHKQDSATTNTRRSEPTTTSNTSGTHQRDASPNTINLDFINSVTALSMDHLNPFAISSVNPAIQRSSGANSERLSPHRLAMPLASVQQQQQQQADQQPTGGANLLATAPARYFSSPELLAALDHHERHDTGQRMRTLLSSNQLGPSNHRSSGSGVASTGANAPYMMQPQEQAAPPVRSLDGILGAKFIVAPTTSSTSLMSEAANSQHKSVVPTPRPSGELGLRQARISSRTIDNAIQRDGFEIRDRQVQADNHRFYEVVSSLKQPTEMTASFQAYRGKFS